MVQQALVFLGAAVLLVPIFQKIGLGSVLGYLLAGIVVGPAGLRLIGDTESILHLAELGVVILLFIIGLEIQPRKFWSMRKHIFGLGGTQVAVTTIIFFIAGILFKFEPITAAVIGFALSLSSTAFAMQTLTENNQFNTEFGRASFAILLMQDLVAIPVLALLPLLGLSDHNFSLSGLIPFIVVVAGLVIVARFVMRPIFRFIASTRSREIFTATILLIVLGTTAIMQEIGLSAALGTFLAGVLLADSEYRHEIEIDIEPFKNLLMGLFFIAVGMEVKLSTVLERPGFILILATAYIFFKFIALYLSAQLFKLKKENAKMVGLTISQGGEFAFVLFGICQQYRLIQAETVNVLIAVITISMAVSPILLKIHAYLEKRHYQNSNAKYDKIDGENAEVIIAGFGRFGQIFARIFTAQKISFVAVDLDPDQIEFVRRFGNKVYYGDAARRDILEAAGAAKAKYIIVAIDDVDRSLQVVKIIKEFFPNLKIFARARNRGHVFDLKDLGVKHIKRELFDSSVDFVRMMLIDRGYTEEKANSLIEKFIQHDEHIIEEQYKVRSDDKSLISVSKQGTVQLAQVFQQDRLQSFSQQEK